MIPQKSLHSSSQAPQFTWQIATACSPHVGLIHSTARLLKIQFCCPTWRRGASRE